MAYRWGPNRDAGCISRHRNPDTKRRYPRGERIMNMVSSTYRNYCNAQLRAAMPLLSTGVYDISFPHWRRGWDWGDPFMPGHHDTVVSEAYAREDVEVWDDYDDYDIYESDWWMREADELDMLLAESGFFDGDYQDWLEEPPAALPSINPVNEWELSWGDIAS